MNMRSLIVIATVALAACSPNVDPVSNSNVAAPVITPVAANDCGLTRTTLLDERALFAAETAYNIPADAYVNLGDKLPAATKLQAKTALIQAYDYLLLARKAYAAADGCSLKRYSDLAVALGDKAKALLPK
jgi:hypothetical protein